MTDPRFMNYCPTCGHPLMDAHRFGQTRRVCEACGFIHFRDPKVAAVVSIVDGKSILLIKRGNSPELGKWSMPGGYIDFGEDPRDAAIREVREETGLEIRITGLIDVIGGDSNIGGASIIIMYEAAIIGGVLNPEDDAQEAVFFSAADVSLIEIANFSSTRLLLDRWLNCAPT